MADEKRDKEEEKGFVVRDKRFTAQKEEEKVPPKKERREEVKEEVTGEKASLPEINFTNFIFSLSTSALIQLGEIEDPFTNKQSKNLPVAKQTIDLIGMLKEKTQGNLTSDEEKFLEGLLFDLRMRYVKAAE